MLFSSVLKEVTQFSKISKNLYRCATNPPPLLELNAKIKELRLIIHTDERFRM